MSNSNGKITAPVSIDNDIAPVLEESNYDLKSLCVSNKVNKWSWIKPFELDNPFPTLEQQKLYSGFVIEDFKTSWNTIVKIFKYKKPTIYFRACDFDGYNHRSSTPSSSVEKMNWTDAPAGTDVRLSETDSYASFNAKITLPEIPLWLFNNPENTGIITINFGVFGSSDFKEEVGRYDITSACGNNPNVYISNYANKTLTIPCKQTRNLPSRGVSLTHKYYVLISNSYIENMDFLSFNATMYRVKSISPNNPEDYDYRIPISWFPPASPSTVPYTKIGNLDYEGYSYIRIENIRNLITGNDLVIKYRTKNKPFTTAITLTTGNEWKTERDIAWYSSPINNGNGWTLVFKRSIGSNDAITEIAIAGERSIGF